MTMSVVAAAIVTEWTETALVNVFGFGVLAAVAALVVAAAYRWYSGRVAPVGVAVLVGLAVVGTWLNTAGIRSATIIDETPLVHHATAVYFLGAVLAGGVAADAGRRVGDHLACEIFGIDTLDATGEAASIVRAGRRSVALELPETIEDASGYPPLENSVKRDLEGRTMLFPDRLAEGELESRLRDRLERAYGVGYATADVEPDGTVERLAVGGKQSGLGRTLPSGSVAVAIRADPPDDASVGDPVEVWDDSSRLVATGTLRATAGDVVTLVVDREDATAFDGGPGSRYRLVTRPESPTAVPAVVAALRGADETVVAASVESASTLEREFVDWIPGSVLAVVRGTEAGDSSDREIVPFPDADVTLAAGDVLYVLGTPTELRELRSADGLLRR